MTAETTGAQRWNPDRYRRNAAFVSELSGPVLDLLNPQPGERILDLGCGDGTIAKALMARGCSVVAVDSSAEQVAAAKQAGIDARVIDAVTLPFAQEFDAVFSNAVLHWVKPPDAAIDGVKRSLKPGGRFVAEFGGAGNVDRIVAALTAVVTRYGVEAADVNPWYFPSPDEYGGKLRAAGFEVVEIGLHPRPTPLPGDISGWLETFADAFLFALAPAQRTDAVAAVADRLRPELCQPDGTWVADYVRLRLSAVLPE